MSAATVPSVGVGIRWHRVGWALPWLLFQLFPIVDLITEPRPAAVRVVAGAGLAVFTGAYLTVFGRAFARGCSPAYRQLLVVVALGVGLAVWLGTPWAGLMIYVSAACATMPRSIIGIGGGTGYLPPLSFTETMRTTRIPIDRA